MNERSVKDKPNRNTRNKKMRLFLMAGWIALEIRQKEIPQE
jgi:hypothetical protein